MAKSPQIQSRVTACRISAIAKDLANGKTRGDILAKYGKKWQLSSRSIDRLTEKAKEQAQTLRNLAAKTANDTLIAETKEAVKQGLKSKLDRVLLLQKQVEDIQADLESGVSIDYVILQGKLQKVNKEISATDKAYLRKTIKDIQAEISKMEGDYAPTKAELTGKDGKPLPTAPAPIMFLSADKLTDDQLQQFLSSNDRTDNEGI